FYVDSEVATAGDGTSWTNAVRTLQEGINKCVANNGDFVYVAQEHAENIASAVALDFDCPGITIVGHGSGEDQPEISFTAGATSLGTISAADVTIYNIRFLGAFTDGITKAIDITANGDGARILCCEFRETDNTMELLVMINVAVNADELVFAGNRFIGTDSADPTDAIVFAGASNKTIVQSNTFIGTWSDCVIDGTVALSTGLNIIDNHVVNLDSTGKTIQFHTSTTGSVIGNKCYGNGSTFAIVADSMFVCPISN
ncbi:unnamed protein product, partial [marine sediment metagenome]